MGKGVKGVEPIHAEIPGGNKYGAAGSQRDIAHIVPHGTGSHRRRRVVPGSRRHNHVLGNPKLPGHLRQYPAYGFIALVTFGKLLFSDAADIAHLF